MDLTALLPLEALKDRAVLGVHRQERCLVPLGGRRHQAARHNERLLVGDGHGLAGLDGGHGGQEPRAAHDGREDDVGLDVARQGDEPARAAQDLRTRMPERPRHDVHGALVRQREGARPVLPAQLGHQLRAGSPRGESFDAELSRVVIDELERATAHRAGRPKHRQSFHALHVLPYVT